MHALGGPDDPLPAILDPRPRAHPVHPGPGGVDEHPPVEIDDVAADEIPHPHGPAAVGAALELLRLGVVDRVRARPARREHVLEAEALRGEQEVVEVVPRAQETLRPEGGLERAGPGGVHCPVARRPLARRQEVVEAEPEAHLDEAPRPAPVDGHQERQRTDQMGRQPRERLPLAQGLPDQPEVEELEVPEPAVDELRRARGRPRGEVDLLDEDAREPALGEVPRDARPGHAAPDDDGVEDLPVQTRQPADGAARRGAGARSLTAPRSRRRPPRREARRASRRRGRAPARDLGVARPRDAAQHQDRPETGRPAHRDVGLEPVAHDDAVGRGEPELVERHPEGDRRGLAHDRVHAAPGHALDGADHPGRVGDLPALDRARPVGVGAHQPRPVARDRLERHVELAVVERPIEGHHDVVYPGVIDRRETGGPAAPRPAGARRSRSSAPRGPRRAR